MLPSLNSTHTFPPQIIEEQLPFPSGTATAHLISVLHQLPPLDTSLKHRSGCHHVEDEEGDSSLPDILPDIPAVEEDEANAIERDVVKHEGWHDLVWSFAASGSLTVRRL